MTPAADLERMRDRLISDSLADCRARHVREVEAGEERVALAARILRVCDEAAAEQQAARDRLWGRA